MNSAIRFATTRDGVRIAYCTHGEGQPLIFVRGWTSHLEVMWQNAAFRKAAGDSGGGDGDDAPKSFVGGQERQQGT